MRANTIRSFAVLAVLVMASASCTMKNQDAPPLTGPSEFGTSVAVQVSPDVLQQDGASQSIVTVTVRDSAGQPQRNVPLRTDIYVGGHVVDFGSLSARSVVTGGDGRATLIYTAPASAGDAESLVDIAATPIGSNAASALPRSATIRLVPTGIRVPPSDLVPDFTFSPQTPAESQPVFFSAEGSRGSIAEYRWDFGNGASGSGRTVTHAFGSPGTYHVRLTLMDSVGRSASATKSVTVGQAAAPVAAFTFSPTAPSTADVVFFNAAESVPAPGRQIVSYTWDLGDGSAAKTGVQVAHQFGAANIYTVTLTVRDDIGRSHTINRQVTIK